mmetsp:Transcript_31642/g.96835  ORF Transcript_31642/g.96835 Transcript_31642/m.96835 type:complete len:148 (-) Transcript_31642:260-703(-)
MTRPVDIDKVPRGSEMLWLNRILLASVQHFLEHASYPNYKEHRAVSRVIDCTRDCEVRAAILPSSVTCRYQEGGQLHERFRRYTHLLLPIDRSVDGRIPKVYSINELYVSIMKPHIEHAICCDHQGTDHFAGYETHLRPPRSQPPFL